MEDIHSYPEPDRYSDTAAYSFYIRHVNGIEFDDVDIHFATEKNRTPFVLKDVSSARFNDVSAQHAPWAPIFVLTDAQFISVHDCEGVPDTKFPQSTTPNSVARKPRLHQHQNQRRP